jgi:hypothetical protein
MTNATGVEALERLVGSWTTEATHPALPGVVVKGTAVVEWLEGKRFLIIRSSNDHPEFPDAIAILGVMEHDRAEGASEPGAMRMHYYDSRGVFRVYETSIDASAWRWWREAPGFSQRFVGTFVDGAIDGRSQLCEDDVNWRDDLAITYRRSK